MKSSKKLKEFMDAELPSISAQKRLVYRTDIKEVRKLFRILNKAIFDDKLPEPEFQIFTRSKDYWGMCEAKDPEPNPDVRKSNVIIHLFNKWYCRQWLIDTLAHEMCHQYQWDVLGKQRVREGKEPIMSHGPSFYVFRDRLKEHGIALKRHHRMKRWFTYQNFFKC